MTERQTGRTTRMLNEAVEQARAGRSVFIVHDSEIESDLTRRRLFTEYKDTGILPLTCCVDVRIGFDYQAMNCSYDYKERVGLLPSKDYVLFVDHHVLERKFSKVLAMMTRFDDPTGKYETI